MHIAWSLDLRRSNGGQFPLSRMKARVGGGGGHPRGTRISALVARGRSDQRLELLALATATGGIVGKKQKIDQITGPSGRGARRSRLAAGDGRFRC